MTATAATESEGIQVGEAAPLTRTKEGNPKESEDDDGRPVVVVLDVVDSDRDATADDDEVAEGETTDWGAPSHTLRGNDAAPERQQQHHHHQNNYWQELSSRRLPRHQQPSTDRRGLDLSSFTTSTEFSSSSPTLRLRRRRAARRDWWAGNARRDLAGANNITTPGQDSNAGNATGNNNITAHNNASAPIGSTGGNHINNITTNGTYHNNATFVANGTATLAPSSAPTTSTTDASAMNYQDRVRVALLSLYVTVLVLCFALPVLYYAKLRLGLGMAATNVGRRSQTRRRRRRRRNGSVEDDDDDDGDNEDPEDGDRLRRAIERSQVETSETRAFRRKYVEERRARIVQLLAPVQMVLSQDNFAAPATLGSSPFLVSPTNPPSSAERKVGKGDDADDDDDDDDDDDACRVRVPVPGVMVGSRHRAALLLVPGGTGSNSNSNSEGGGSLHGSAKSLSGGVDDATTTTAALTSPPVSQLLYESRWVSGVCSICLCPYQPGDSVCWSSNPQCDHCFHASCIEPWLLKQRDGPLCPICRRDFLIDPYDAVIDDDVVSSTPTAAVAAADGGAVSEAAVGSDVDVEGAATASADVTSNRNGGAGSNNSTTNDIGRAATTTASNRAMRTQAFGLNWF